MTNSRNEELEKFLLELSMYQDQLLQNYRQLFIATQTIIISIAMLLLASTERTITSICFYVILFVIGLILMSLWKKITRNRSYDVSYCHMQLLRLERKDNPLSRDEIDKPFDSFKEWQNHNEDSKISTLNNYDHHLLASRTRQNLEKLPNKFIIIWITGLIIFVILYLNNRFNFF